MTTPSKVSRTSRPTRACPTAARHQAAATGSAEAAGKRWQPLARRPAAAEQAVALSMKPCLDCGVPASGSRCRRHQREYERRRGTPAERGYDETWRLNVRVAITAQPFCSSCRSTTDLTGDHIVPLSRGGTNRADNIRVLCRSCNSRKGARATRDGRGGARTGPDARVPLDISARQSFDPLVS
jgi:5-methylcytosine-specific restriction protein A